MDVRLYRMKIFLNFRTILCDPCKKSLPSPRFKGLIVVSSPVGERPWSGEGGVVVFFFFFRWRGWNRVKGKKEVSRKDRRSRRRVGTVRGQVKSPERRTKDYLRQSNHALRALGLPDAAPSPGRGRGQRPGLVRGPEAQGGGGGVRSRLSRCGVSSRASLSWGQRHGASRTRPHGSRSGAAAPPGPRPLGGASCVAPSPTPPQGSAVGEPPCCRGPLLCRKGGVRDRRRGVP